MATLTQSDLDRYADDYYLSQDDDKTSNRMIEMLGQRHVFHLVGKQLEELQGNRIREDLPGVRRILDMGLGDGTMLELLHGLSLLQGETFETLDIVEGSPKLCARFEPTSEKISIIESMFTDYIPETRYDAVLCLHVLDHIPEPGWLMEHIATHWLDAGGMLIAVVPNAHSFHRQLAVEMDLQLACESLGEADKMVGHYRVYDKNRLRNLAEYTGFHMSMLTSYQMKALPNSMMTGLPREVIEALYSMDIPQTNGANLIAVMTRKNWSEPRLF